MNARNVSLFDVDDVKAFGAVKDMNVAKASRRDVHEFCRRWHYSGTGGSAMWNYGLWDGFTLVGVVSYNMPTMEVCSVFFGPERWQWVTHMGRLVCADDAPRNSESRLIAGSLRMLKYERPTLRAVVTYASTFEGHIGYVYQATNALYCGTTSNRHQYLDELGRTRSTKQGDYLTIEEALQRGWTVQHEPPKHRYLYLLGDKRERREALALLRVPVQSYPKASRPGAS